MASTYEAVTVGATRTFGTYEVTQDEIVAFAEQYDPQPFHTDPEAARESMFGELVASGWHVAAMTMRLLVDNYLDDSGAMGSPGVEELRWREPVRAGDELAVETEHVGKEPWGDDRGVVRTAVTTRRQDDATVMTMTAQVLYPRE